MRKFKKYLMLVYAIFCVSFLLYLTLPLNNFPEPPVDAIQSFEPADIEEDSRRGYYTNYTREEAINHYQEQFNRLKLINIPSFRLNYPPEEAQTIIRDQTRSTYLEELAHPLRESIFINGFEPSLPQDVLLREDKYWYQKITVRHVTSSLASRLFVGFFILLVIPILTVLFAKSIKVLLKGLTVQLNRKKG